MDVLDVNGSIAVAVRVRVAGGDAVAAVISAPVSDLKTESNEGNATDALKSRDPDPDPILRRRPYRASYHRTTTDDDDENDGLVARRRRRSSACEGR
jgi:hypothetical protein